jgi:transcriptional regulator with XRE-family HTH domain
MTNGTKKTTAVLAGAVVLASGGYALGTQGDGAAIAQSGGSTTSTTPTPPEPPKAPGHLRGPGGPGFDDLADKLGVSALKLRAALEKVRPQVGGRDRDEHLEAFAKALGKSVDEVRAAQDKLRAAAEDEFNAAIAKALGMSADEVKKAREGVKSQGRERFDEVAKALGVSADKLEDAVRSARPGRHGFGDHEADLAKALGVTTEQLDKARDALRKDFEAQADAKRKELAAALAKELGIEASKVEDALGDGPRFFGRGGHRHGGPGGPGPGGPGGPDGPGGPGGPFGPR